MSNKEVKVTVKPELEWSAILGQVPTEELEAELERRGGAKSLYEKVESLMDDQIEASKSFGDALAASNALRAAELLARLQS